MWLLTFYLMGRRKIDRVEQELYCKRSEVSEVAPDNFPVTRIFKFWFCGVYAVRYGRFGVSCCLHPEDHGLYRIPIFFFLLALQPNAGYGLLIHEFF